MKLSEFETYVRYLTSTDANSYSDSDIKFNLNRALHEFNSMILGVIDGWSISESTNIKDLTADTAFVTFPTGIIKIKRIEIDYNGDGIFTRVIIFDINERSGGNDSTSIDQNFSKEKPFADISDKIYLFPIPTITISNGLKIWYEAEPTELSGDNDEPDILEAFQPWMAFSTSRDYYIKTDQDERADRMEVRMEKLFAKAKKFYGIRSNQKVIVKSGSSNEQYSNI